MRSSLPPPETQPAARWVARRVVVACVALVALTGCGAEPGPGPAAAPSVVPDSELCPDRLFPTDAGEGMGVEEPAATAPDLPAPDRAWICGYQDVAVGLPFRWARSTEVREVTGADLQELTAELDGLTAGPRSGACTADLGPRYAVVVRAGEQQYAVLKDMFSCGDVRLTDDLGTGAAGDPTGPGTVRGIVGDTATYRDLLLRLGESLPMRMPTG